MRHGKPSAASTSLRPGSHAAMLARRTNPRIAGPPPKTYVELRAPADTKAQSVWTALGFTKRGCSPRPLRRLGPCPLLQTWVTRTWRAWGARVECSDQPGLVLGTHHEPPHPDPERTQPHPLRPIQRDLDQARSGAIDKSGASPVVDSAENVETQRTTQFAQAPVQWPGRCNGLARDRGLKGPPHANVDC